MFCRRGDMQDTRASLGQDFTDWELSSVRLSIEVVTPESLPCCRSEVT